MVDKGYFEEEVVTVKTREEVEIYAAAECFDNQTTFKHCAFHVVHGNVEIVTELKPRKLTWWERISGNIRENLGKNYDNF